MNLAKKLGVACLVLAFATFSSFAGAADLGGAPARTSSWEPAPQSYANPAIWTGLYGGISLGYGWGQSDLNYDRAGHGHASTDPSGALGALTLGYNYQMGSDFVVGLEADLGIMDVSADDKIVFDGHNYKSQFGPWWGTVRGRAGYAVDHTLFYGTAGVAFMETDEIAIGNTPGETAINKDLRSGWVVGGGVEHAFASNATVKLEYLHMDFGKYDGFSTNQEAFSFENTVDLVRAGVNYKF
jgi:outer membrane immunogenic protein